MERVSSQLQADAQRAFALRHPPFDRERAWRRRPSALARFAWVVYVLIILDASLYPFTGWEDIGVGAFDYLRAPWPRHALEFDIVVNVLGYLPFGLLGVAALYPQVRGALAAVVVVLAATLLSGSMEALQTFLPTRVASNVDLLTNVAGAAIGVVLGLFYTEALLDRGRLRLLRLRWFERDASALLALVLLWFGAVLYPQRYALGLGNVIDPLSRVGVDWLPWTAVLDSYWPADARFAEGVDALVAATGLAGMLLAMQSVTRPAAPRIRLILTLVALTVLAKTFGTGLTYASTEPLIWITPGAIVGFSLATMLATLLGAASVGTQRWVAWGCLLVALIFTNLGPDTTYFDVVSRSWERGRLLNFYGLALGLSLAWPFAMLVALTLAKPAQHQGLPP